MEGLIVLPVMIPVLEIAVMPRVQEERAEGVNRCNLRIRW